MTDLTVSEASAILGIETSSINNHDAVKAAYKRMALKTHPDKNRDDPDASAKFQRVAEAFQRLLEVGSPSYTFTGFKYSAYKHHEPTAAPQSAASKPKPFRKRGTGGPDFDAKTYQSSPMYENSFRHSYKSDDRFPHGYTGTRDGGESESKFPHNYESSSGTKYDESGPNSSGRTDGSSSGAGEGEELAFRMFSEVFGTDDLVHFSDGESGFTAEGDNFSAAQRAYYDHYHEYEL